MTGHAASKGSLAASMRPYLGLWLKQRRQHPVRDPLKGSYLYPLWLRLWHWVNALLFLTLIVTGISLHYADIRAPLIPFNTARLLHFGVDSWSDQYPLENGRLRNVEPHWMRQMGTLMINHGIQKEGRKCAECHDSKGIMDFVKLGYPPERVSDLQNLPELKLKYFQSMQGPSKQIGTSGRKPAGTPRSTIFPCLMRLPTPKP